MNIVIYLLSLGSKDSFDCLKYLFNRSCSINLRKKKLCDKNLCDVPTKETKKLYETMVEAQL